MVGIVIVSHSHLLAEGLKQMAMDLSRNVVQVAAAGGLNETTIGTCADRIHRAILDVYSHDGVIIFFDLGSALFSTQIALEMLPPEIRESIHLSDSPLVEGTLIATVESSLGKSLNEVCAAVQQTHSMKKC